MLRLPIPNQSIFNILLKSKNINIFKVNIPKYDNFTDLSDKSFIFNGIKDYTLDYNTYTINSKISHSWNTETRFFTTQINSNMITNTNKYYMEYLQITPIVPFLKLKQIYDIYPNNYICKYILIKHYGNRYILDNIINIDLCDTFDNIQNNFLIDIVI